MKKIIYTSGLNVSNLNSLIDFERRSWPEEEQASQETLSKRLAEFPQGFTVAMVDEKIVGQTYWKPVIMPESIESFETMSELPVNANGKTMWGVNLAVDPAFAGNGIASELARRTIRLAKSLGVNEMQAGLRLEKMQQLVSAGIINLPEEYPVGKIDALAKAFISAANKENAAITFSKPQKYWEVDAESMGYASIVTIKIKET